MTLLQCCKNDHVEVRFCLDHLVFKVFTISKFRFGAVHIYGSQIWGQQSSAFDWPSILSSSVVSMCRTPFPWQCYKFLQGTLLAWHSLTFWDLHVWPWHGLYQHTMTLFCTIVSLSHLQSWTAPYIYLVLFISYIKYLVVMLQCVIVSIEL